MADRSIRAIYILYVSPSPVAVWPCAGIGSTTWTSLVMSHDP